MDNTTMDNTAMPGTYTRELHIAALAVQRASLVTKAVLASANKGSLTKSDSSPVTIADFAAQALLIAAIHGEFPNDRFVGEESGDALRADPELMESVWVFVSSPAALVGVELLAEKDDDQKEVANAPQEGEPVLLATPASKEEMLEVIDLGGNGVGGPTGRIWMLDPVDGTATFIRGEQYAVCLTLVEDGKQKVGILGCPNLDPESVRVGTTATIREDTVDREGYGLMLSAILGQGAQRRKMLPRVDILAVAEELRLPSRRTPDLTTTTAILEDMKETRFVDSLASASISLDKHRAVWERLGIVPPVNDLWSMQMKYVALALGASDAMIRIPVHEGYRSYVWDHAGGQIIFEEAGGKVSDLHGQTFDFGVGRKLHKNYGFVATKQDTHGLLLDAVQKVLSGE